MNRFFSFVAALAVLSGLASAAVAADAGRVRAGAGRYDQEYPVIDYSAPATRNRIWRLQQQLDSGEVQLQWEPKLGYLRSLLDALQIDIDSQVLVYSKTSLQVEGITPQTPRAIYFNDDTYVGYVQGSGLIELTAIDPKAGAVFYGLDNRREAGAGFQREGGACLSCHDTYSMMGGGVPRVLVMSTPVDDPLDTRTFTSASEVDDRTPLAARWGGWYVTGHTGRQAHLGNLPVREDRAAERLRQLRAQRFDLESLRDYFDTAAYPADRSDVVALLVLEHQAQLQNLITRVNFKVRTVLARDDSTGSGGARTWNDVGPRDQTRVKAMIEPLVRALFMHDAATFDDRITGNSGFAERFQRQGPRDKRGRSLRELDLQTRLFRYPLSFMIHSDQLDGLPEFVLDHLYTRIADVLQGRDTTGIGERIAPADRAAIAAILADTKPALARVLGGVRR